MTKKSKKFLFFFAMAILVTTVSVFAAPIVQTVPFGPNLPSFTKALTFNKFDTLGGTRTLTSIQVTLNLQAYGGELRLDNDSETPASGSFDFGAKGTISSGDVALFNATPMPIPGQVNAYHSASFTLAANVGDIQGDYDPTPPDGMLFIGHTETDTKSGFVGSIFWGGYQGTGTYDINCEITQWINYGSIGGIEYAVTPVSANGYVEVTYNYVPEPATISLLCIGALTLLKRKSSK